MKLCVDCIHVNVCYRQGIVDLNYADKCGDYMSDKVIDDIKAEIKALGNESAQYVPNYEAYKRCLDIIDKHISGKENGNATEKS